MNDKQQLAAMGEHMAEQKRPLCMAKRIEDLEVQVRVMAGALNDFREFVSANVWDDSEREDLLASIDSALSGKLPDSALPEGWKLVEKPNCFVLIHEGQVVASMAGPTAENTASILASVLAGRLLAPAAPEGWQLVPVEPTREMMAAAMSAITQPQDLPHSKSGWGMNEMAARTRYCAMLAASPKPNSTK